MRTSSQNLALCVLVDAPVWLELDAGFSGETEFVVCNQTIQYASIEYRKALNDLKATCSMSRKGNCWDNAVMESFFSTLKLELDLDKMIGDRAFTRTTVFSWIEGWYNRVRKHSSLGYLSPAQFEAKLLN
jgi:transposase InsO family protein